MDGDPGAAQARPSRRWGKKKGAPAEAGQAAPAVAAPCPDAPEPAADQCPPADGNPEVERILRGPLLRTVEQRGDAALRNECGEYAHRAFIKLPFHISSASDRYEQDLRTCLIGGSLYLPGFFQDADGIVMDQILTEVRDSMAREGGLGKDGPALRAAEDAASPPPEPQAAECSPKADAGGWRIERVEWSKHQIIERCLERSRTFGRIIRVLEEYFDIEIYVTRLNWYENQDHWKPFHKDSHAYGPNGNKEDFTVGVSFGAERCLEFVHDDCAEFKFGFPQRNGDVFAFSDVVNLKFKHGVPRVPNREKRGTRISVLGWGRRVRMTRRNGGVA